MIYPRSSERKNLGYQQKWGQVISSYIKLNEDDELSAKDFDKIIDFWYTRTKDQFKFS